MKIIFCLPKIEIDIGSPENDKECFCRDPPDECPKKGRFFEQYRILFNLINFYLRMLKH